MNPHVVEWLNLTFRWMHVIVGVAWIGASFYFVWLENNLERGKKELGEGIAGDLWAIHGGGFYYLKKFEVAPPRLPETLHWFKWEAYATWLTGVTLMTIVYYLNADTYMVDASVADIGSMTAIGIGIGSLVIGWIVYDVLCRTPLLKYPTAMLAVMFAFLTGAAWLLSQYLAPRAAYIHVGAMIGTMMAGNVLMVIIPGQKRLVAAAERGEEPDAWQGIYAGLRSRHNNYFTLPVLFIMISNHFSSTWGHEWGWLVLAGISAAGIAVRHHFNVRHRTNRWAWTMPAAGLALVGLAYFTAPDDAGGDVAALEAHPPVEFSEAKAIIATRCLQCHSETPTDDVFTAPPNGVVFDSDREIARWASRMKVRVYDLHTMPLANKTGMTEDERLTLAAWVHQGASTR
jgi:uncharacterized membrane protein